MKFTRHASLLSILWLLFAGLIAPALADSVKTTLSSNTASVGESVEYTLTVDGSFQQEDAPVPQVDGLEVRHTAYSSQMRIVNGDFSRSVEITYTLVPKREGTFTIPAMEMPVGGQKLKTREVKLTVTAGQQTTQAGDLAFAEIRLGKKDPYVGEAIPLELRVFLDNSARWDLQQMPALSGSGFTLKPFGKPAQREVQLAGKSYIELTFRSVIIPGKAGKVSIGPVPIKALYSAANRRRRDPFDLFDTRPTQELEVTAPAAEIDARLLPTEGRPADFTGAIGKFEFTGIGTPNRVNVGEPVQMVLSVSGEGNFDRIGTPAIAEPTGWRAYDAKVDFVPTDTLGFTGTKTFTLPVAPTTRKTTMPVFAFNYFDPDTGKYHEVKSSSEPLTVTGAELPTPEPALAAAPKVAAPTPEPPREAQDILGILPPGGLAWTPGIQGQTLYWLLAAPAPVLAALVALRRRASNSAAQRVQRLKRERARALESIRASKRAEELHEAAVRALQIDAAITNGKEAHACDISDILAARQLSQETVKAIEELFHARAAFAYAGGTRNEETVRANDRDRILDLLATYNR